MKSSSLLAVLLSLAASAASVHGQASVIFVNRLPATFITPVHLPNPLNPQTRLSGNANTNGGFTDYTGHPLVTGTTFISSLWAAPVSQGVLPLVFEQIATSRFRTLAQAAGTWSPLENPAIIPFITTPGTPAQFQVRVWDSQNDTLPTWAAALANPASVLGSSDIFVLTPRFFPNTPGYLEGLTSFNLTVVPEPAALAFGLLGTVLASAWRVGRR